MFRVINSFVHCLTINIIRITKNNHTTSTDWKEMAKKTKKKTPYKTLQKIATNLILKQNYNFIQNV